MAEERFDEAGFAVFFAIFAEGFGDAVGVEDEGVAGVDGALAQFAIPLFENAEDGGGGVEAVDRIVTAEDERGRMAAIDVAETAGGGVVIGQEERGEGTVRSVLGEELVDDTKNIFQAILRDGALAAEIGLQIGHEESGGDAFAGDVADDEAEAAWAEIEKVVIVAAHSARWIAVAAIVERGDRGANLGEKAALDFAGDFEFLSSAAFEFEFGGVGAALGFESVGDFVEADEKESVAVKIAETGRDAAPDVCFLAEEGRPDSGADGARFGVELNATEARSLVEADAPFGPFLVFGEDVFGDEDHARGPADELVVLRVGFGCDQGEDGLAVGRGHGDEAFAGLEFGVVGEVEAELVDVEAEAAVLVADVDVDGVDAKVGRRLRGWCGRGHGEIIRRGDEEKKKITQRRRVRGDPQSKKEKSRPLASLGMTSLGTNRE
jgi:hypothetical protein